MMMIRDVMSAPAQTCHPETDVAAVVKLMWDHDCGFVPVVGANGAVVGVISDRDICIASATRRMLPEYISAAEAMTSPIYSCLPTDKISDALATMKRFRIRRLPVLDENGHLQGVISMNDIVRASERKGRPAAKEIVSTMASICAHRSVARAVA